MCHIFIFQVWFKNRRAKCRQQQKAHDQGKGPSSKVACTKKNKSPPPPQTVDSNSNSPTPYKHTPISLSSNLSSTSPSSLTSSGGGSTGLTGNGSTGNLGGVSGAGSGSSIWSPASITPSMGSMNDLVNSSSCMAQRSSYPMPNSHHQTPSYNSQNYGPSSYYGNMDYFPSMPMSSMTSNQMSSMASSGLNPHSMSSQMSPYGNLSSQSLPRSSISSDCLEYKDNTGWQKFHVL